MGWSGSLNANSAVGAAITYTPDTTGVGAYTVSSFTAPKKGVYCFQVRGSGGNTIGAANSTRRAPGKGGLTIGYMLMEAGQTVYIGAGGYCSAAFVSKATGSSLAAISASNLYFVAGAGGQNGASWDANNNNGGAGGDGGGTSGSNASEVPYGGYGGTQTGGGSGASGSGSYGKGAGGGYVNCTDGSGKYTSSSDRGRGGDGYYGGGGGDGFYGYAGAGGGGSGYIHTNSVQVNSKTYTNSTQQGGGAAADNVGSVTVIFYARAELPVIFNGTTLERLIFNGVEAESLIYDGTKLFMRRLRNAAQNCIAAWRHGAHFLRNQRAYA